MIYTPGLSIDQPLSVTRFGYRDYPNPSASLSVAWTPFAIYPHWNARGVATSGTLASGGWTRWYDMGLSSSECPPVGDASGRRCLTLQWPAGYGAYDQKRGVGQHWRAWHGSLLTQKRDGSGLEYKRNRQYDPQTGRFTQQDPIGLAGGMNLYGYAGGDPVNYGDPFGLKVCFKGSDVRGLRLQTERAVGGSIAVGADGCVTDFRSHGLRGFEELGALFIALVGSAHTFNVQYGSSSQRYYSGFDPNTRTATILKTDGTHFAYETGNRLSCALMGGHRRYPQSLDAVIAHELLGHGTFGGSEIQARRVENLVHAAAGRPARCN